MAAIKFLRLEDFLDNQRHGMAIHLEPQGILFAEVRLSLLPIPVLFMFQCFLHVLSAVPYACMHIIISDYIFKSFFVQKAKATKTEKNIPQAQR